MFDIYVNGSQEMYEALHKDSEFDMNSRINRAMSNEAEAQGALTKALKTGIHTAKDISVLRIKRNIAAACLRDLQLYTFK